MKKILIILISVILSSCNNYGIGKILKDVYGDEFECSVNENVTTYVMDYSFKREKIEGDVIRLCDKIDKFTNSLYKDGLEFAYKSDGNTSASASSDCISHSREWNTPTTRICMTTDRCINDKGNKITISVVKK